MSEEVHELIGLAKQGDAAAMRRLVDLYAPRVFGLCCRMLRHREDAEDAAQETMVRMFKSLNRWDDTRPFEPWLLAIAGNRCRTKLARRASGPINVTLEDTDVPVYQKSDEAVRQINEEIRQALVEVTPRYRQAFLGFHEHGLSYAQIAEWLEVPLGTVKSWVRRARLQLMEHLRARGAIEESHHELRQV